MVATDSGWSWGRSLLWAVGLLVMTFLLAPILVIVGVSFNESRFLTFPPTDLSLQWYKALWQSRSWREAAQFSFWLAIAVTAAALILGVPAAYALARGRFFGVRAVEFFLVSPMVVPVVVLAIGLYILFAPLRLVGTPFALFLGHTLLAMPIVIVIAGGAFRRLSPNIELSARSCGATFSRAFWHVTLPAVRPAVISSAAFAFLTSFDEVVLALFLGGPSTNTLPKRIWEAVKFEVDPSLTAVSTLLVLLTVLALCVGELGRRLQRVREEP